jgi:thermostable 8-oxoguanine DNA glycosylase
MKEAHIGQYTRLVRCWRESLSLDLRNDPVEAFEAIHGVGPKTARMFMMHSRPDQRLAAIDTHVLKHLRANGHDVPSATPSSGKLYRKLEEAFLALADEAGESPADYDLRVWKSYAR